MNGKALNGFGLSDGNALVKADIVRRSRFFSDIFTNGAIALPQYIILVEQLMSILCVISDALLLHRGIFFTLCPSSLKETAT